MPEFSEKKLVDAIEDGKIVRVEESYANREGLLILRKFEPPKADPAKMQEHMKFSPRLRGDRKVFADLDRFRRPLRNVDEIRASLIDNFHWVLLEKRKQLNMSRKQVAFAVGIKEEDLKSLEVGVLPQHDYVLINKLEGYYKVNLRKGVDFRESQRPNLVEQSGARVPKWMNKSNLEKENADKLVSSSIEIDEGALDK